MKFQIKDLKKLLYSVQQKRINEIKIQSNDFHIIINTKKNTKIYSTKRRKISKIVNREKSNIHLQKQHRQINKISESTINDYSTILSPMVGTFYSAPAPNEPPFVELYDTVQKKQTVCIIEAMKLMNEIEAEIAGEIVEILVQDGDIIDCGQALMRVKPINEQT